MMSTINIKENKKSFLFSPSSCSEDNEKIKSWQLPALEVLGPTQTSGGQNPGLESDLSAPGILS